MNLPNIIIIGAQKCGTSTLHNSLISHSQINSPIDPSNGEPIKEIDFFCYEENWSKGIEWYASHFIGPRNIFIDSSPNYVTFPSCYKRIHDLVPEVKLILCIRNPIDRAYSQYNFYRKNLAISKNWDWNYKETFLQNIKAELKINNPKTLEGFLSKGKYIYEITHLLNYFRRDQLHITILERWKDNYAFDLDTVQSFLNLNREILVQDICHITEYGDEPLDDEIFHLLSNYYKPYNDQLFSFLNHEITEWRTNP